MIKTIDTTKITDDMVKVFHSPKGLTMREAMVALLESAPAVESSQPGWLRAIDEALVCHDVGIVNADDTYEQAKDKLNKLLCVVQDIGAYFAKQEPAQAVPVGYFAGWYGGHMVLRLLDPALVLPENTALYTRRAPLDSETKRLVLELCRLTIDNGAVDGIVTAAMEEMAAKIRERLGAGE